MVSVEYEPGSTETGAMYVSYTVRDSHVETTVSGSAIESEEGVLDYERSELEG